MGQGANPAGLGHRGETITTTRTTGVREAAALMRRHGIHHLVVMERDAVVGMLSDRDLWARGFTTDGIALDELRTVGDVMTPLGTAVDTATDVATVVRAMRSSGVSALPIVADGRLTGIVTESDLIDVLSYALQARAPESSALDDVEARTQVLLGRPAVQSFMQLLSEAGI
jgi:CBS domain-containing protein